MTRQEMESMLIEMRSNKEIMEMQIVEMSLLLYRRYESLKEAGFTEQQAFTIVLNKGLG